MTEKTILPPWIQPSVLFVIQPIAKMNKHKINQTAKLTISAPKSSVFKKFEIQFDIETVAENPYFYYDETPPPGVTPQIGVTVEGIFTSPSGQVLRQPGFFHRETIHTVSGERMHFMETAQSHWKVRFSPIETGEYSVSLRVQDASGTTTISA